MSSHQNQSTATSRENPMTTQGHQPFSLLSLWLFILSGTLVLIAGSVMFSGGSLWDYGHTVVPGYATPSKEITPIPAMDAYTKLGEKMFSQCTVCHKRNGQGDGMAYPPLDGSDWVNGPSLRPAMIILNGLNGPITVKGKTFSATQMTAQAHIKGPKELAAVLNYIRNQFGNKSELVITIEMAQEAFDLTKKRGEKPMSVKELNEFYKRELKGKPLDPTTLVHPKTFKPIQ